MNLKPCSLVVSLCISCAFAQEATEQKKAPSTKLEAFQSRTGVVLIRGFSRVGTFSGSLGGSVSVAAREFRDGSNPSMPRAVGISVSVKAPGRLERENTSYIDLEEIDSLLKGIEYISKASKDVTKLGQFEIDYRTKGDLRVTVFNNQQGEVSAAISSGTIGRADVFVSLSDLGRLRELISAAKDLL